MIRPTLLALAALVINFVPNPRVTLVGGQAADATVWAGATYGWTNVIQNASELQWTRQGTNLPGQTNMSIVLTNIQPDNEGTYVLLASNAISSLRLTNIITVNPTVFYISATGNDAASGKLPTTAWASPSMVTNSGKLGPGYAPGTNITFLFKRGDSWTNISTVLNIRGYKDFTLDAYGTGPLPRMVGAGPFTNTWTLHAGTIWKASEMTNAAYPVTYCIYTNGVPVYDAQSTNGLAGTTNRYGIAGGVIYFNSGEATAPTNVTVSLGQNTGNYGSYGTLALTSCTNAFVKNIGISQSVWVNGYYGIALFTLSNVVVDGCEVSWFGKHAIGLIDCGLEVWVKNSTCSNALSNTGQALVSFNDTATPAMHYWVGNTVTNAPGGFYTHAGGGAGFEASSVVLVQSNTFFSTSVSSEDSNYRTLYLDNTFYQPDPAIAVASLYTGAGCEFSRNKIIGGNGVALNRTTFRTRGALRCENNIFLSANSSIHINGASDGPSPCIVQGNLVSAGYGLWFDGAATSNTVVRGNIVAAGYAVWNSVGYSVGPTNCDYNVYALHITNGTFGAGALFNGNFTYTNWVAKGADSNSVNGVNLANMVTNGYVPVVGSTPVDFVPWVVASSWGLTNDVNLTARGSGNAVTAGAVELTP